MAATAAAVAMVVVVVVAVEAAVAVVAVAAMAAAAVAVAADVPRHTFGSVSESKRFQEPRPSGSHMCDRVDQLPLYKGWSSTQFRRGLHTRCTDSLH